jgi:hypothetical protein
MRTLIKTVCQLSGLLILATMSASAQQAHYQKHGEVLLPDDSVTPVSPRLWTLQRCARPNGEPTSARFQRQ